MLIDRSLSVGEKAYNFLVVILILLFLTVCVSSLVGALNWVNKPFTGFLFYKNLVITDTSYGIAKKIGLDRGSDRIVEVDGRKLFSPDEIYEVINNLPVGTLIDYRISRDGDLIKLSIPTMRFTLADFLSLFGVIYFVGLFFFIVGASVYYLKPTLYSSRIFFLFCFSVGIWFVTSFHSQSTYLFNKLPFLGGLFSPTFAFCLACVFPFNKISRKIHNVVFLLTFVFSSLLFGLNTLYFYSHSIWRNIDVLIWLYIILGSLALPVSSIVTYLKVSTVLERQRAEVILLGSFVGLFLPALTAINIVIFKANIPFNLLALPVIVFPVSIAYAIVRHNLFDIDEIVKKGLAYVALTGVTGVVFGLAVVGFNWILADYGGWKHPATFVIPAIFIVFLINPLKSRIQDLIDTAFFRKSYDYSKTISELSAAMTSILDIDDISNKITDTITKTMSLDSASLFLFSHDTNDYRVYVSTMDDLREKGFIVKSDSPLIFFLDKYKKEIFKEDLTVEQKYIIYRGELMKLFQKLRASVIIPLIFKDELIGILTLGEKKSGLMYTSRDMKLLRTLANQSAIAVENALTFKLVEDYARKLEETNRELKETQAQLIQSEKMSAIGQVAAGIAHEIRNPLNIIEGARYYLSQTIKGEHSAAVGEYLDYIKSEVERTNHLIDNLLRFSKVEPPRFELLDINGILENTLILVRKQLSDANVKLITNLNQQIPNIMGDTGQLWQVFINIVINAIQAMPEGGELQVDTGFSYRSPNHIFISFRDTGMGIDKEDLPKIFNPFFTTKDTGTGLGLSIIYRIVEEHKGKVMVSSEKGKGSTFVVELPISHNMRR